MARTTEFGVRSILMRHAYPDLAIHYVHPKIAAYVTTPTIAYTALHPVNATVFDKLYILTVHPTFFLRPTWAWKPLLIAVTDLLEPHDSHDTKKIRFSFCNTVSGDLHVLQVTYSTVTDNHGHE